MENSEKSLEAIVGEVINNSHLKCVVSDSLRRRFLSDLVNNAGGILSQWPDPENHTFEQAALFFCVKFNKYFAKRLGFAAINQGLGLNEAEQLNSRLNNLYLHDKCEKIDFGDAKHLLQLDVLSLYLHLENEEMFKLTHTLEIENTQQLK